MAKTCAALIPTKFSLTLNIMCVQVNFIVHLHYTHKYLLHLPFLTFYPSLPQNHSHAYIPTHNRTFSEHTLKGEGETTDGDEIDEDKDHFDLTDDDTSASITNIKTTRVSMYMYT